MDDYRQFPLHPHSDFAKDSDEHLNDCIARIETLKFRVIADQQMDYDRRDDLIDELNTLRAAIMHLATLGGPTGAGVRARRMRRRSPLNRKKLKIDGIVGDNLRIREILEKIAILAPSPLPVLLDGETGTGKDLFARVIHLNSGRTPFVTMNCGAIPEGLIESELFGHVKGAFTGAVTDRPGRFEEADGGTIFLDEVGELGLIAQVKLLRVLDHGEIQRVGSDKTRLVSTRVVAATNKNLDQMVRDGSFREDLFYRLNVCHFHIPPLRERRDEIPQLMDYFFNMACQEAGMLSPTIDEELNIFLCDRYRWPGNIRELRNVCYYIAHVSRGQLVTIDDLQLRYQREFGLEEDLGLGERAPEATDYRKSVTEAEKEFLIGMLTKHRGNVRAISEEMALSRARLYQLFSKCGLKPSRYRAPREDA